MVEIDEESRRLLRISAIFSLMSVTPIPVDFYIPLFEMNYPDLASGANIVSSSV